MPNQQVNQWLNHPISRLLLKIVEEHYRGTKEQVTEGVMGCKSISDLDLHIVSQLKGQALAFEQILDIHNFITEEDLEKLNSEE